MRGLIELSERETKRLIVMVYDELYADLVKADNSVWESEKLASLLMQDSLETMYEMLNVYTEMEAFEKCVDVKRWIASIETSNIILSLKNTDPI